MLDHAKEGGVAVFVPADFTNSVLRKKAAFGTGLNLVPGFLQGMGQILGGTRRCGEEVEGEPFGGAGADAGKFAESGDKPKCGGRVIGHQRSTIRASKSLRAALMAGSLRKVSLAEEAGEEAGRGAVGFVSTGAGLETGAGREAAASARVSDPGTASFFRMVSRLTRSRCSHIRRIRISKATSRAKESRR